MFFLIRHAAHPLTGTHLLGRSAVAPLDPAGRAQAERLGSRMRRERFDLVHASPRERTMATANAIADASGGPDVEARESLDEIDFGDWSGLDFETLSRDPEWRRWNGRRSLARAPGGESMLEAQGRIVTHIERLTREKPNAAIVLVTHGEMIRATLAYHLGMSLDAWRSIEISPASISKLAVGGDGATVSGVNETVS